MRFICNAAIAIKRSLLIGIFLGWSASYLTRDHYLVKIRTENMVLDWTIYQLFTNKEERGVI